MFFFFISNSCPTCKNEVKMINYIPMKKVSIPWKFMKIVYSFMTLCFLLINLFSLQAQTHIANSTTVKIEAGTTFSNSSDLLLDVGGSLNNQGTMVIKGNLINNNTTASNLGTGTFEFAGTAAQTISGPNIFTNLSVNNATGVALSGTYDNQVTGILTLSTGLLTLGNTNLSLGPLASIAGTLSSAKMIVATGTGELRKEYSGTGSFTFPVGDNDGTAEYSPVTANFTSGTFGSGNFLGVSLKNLPDPDPNISTGDYLNRYWNLNNNGITGSISCNVSFSFLPADVNGLISNLYCLKTFPNLVTYNKYTSGNILTGTVTSFSRFTGARAGQTAAFTAFLEGPNDGTGSMTGFLPGFTSSNSDSPFPLYQPYSGDPWLYSGGEHVTSVPTGVVDWIYLELRQSSSPGSADASTIFGRRAAFLKTNGSIVDLDGISPVKFYNAPYNPANNVYLVVKHRNHLAIMSSSGSIKNPSGVFAYDFTDSGAKTYGYPDGIKFVSGKWSLVGGNGYPDSDINSDDYTISWDPEIGLFDGYYSGDFNLNGTVDSDDYTLIWDVNIGNFAGITDHAIHGFHSMVP
jgi:hypothetical protein